MAGQPQTMTAEQILEQIGPAVLLSIPRGEKGPRKLRWQKLTLADMTPSYLASLNHGHNIGVLLGQASNGLCTIDCDDDPALEAFLRCNPQLRESLISRGRLRGNVRVRILGEYPKAAKLKREDGTAAGEWRATGNQTVIFGKHPSGADYVNNGKSPLEITFAKIRWPDCLEQPWKASAPQPTQTASESDFTPNDAGRADRFVARYGQDIRFVPERGLWFVWDSTAGASDP